MSDRSAQPHNGTSTEMAQADPLGPDAPKGFDAKRVSVIDRYVSHPGRKLTAGQIRSAFAQAELGDPEVQCDIFDDRLETDAHMRDALEGRVEAVARKRWIIAPGGDSPADRRAASALEEAIRDIPGWREVLAHQLQANWYGYAYSELVWERRERLAVPVHFENVIPRRFRFDEQDDRPLLRMDGNIYPGKPLTPGKWWGTERRRRGKAAMGGLMRTAVWWSMFKSFSVRDWLVFANRYGLPYAWATWQHNMSDDEKDAVKRMMASLGTDGWATFTKGVEVHIAEVNKSGGADGVHGALVDLCNAEISKLITGATLITENKGKGSYAATREHGARGYARIAGDAEWIGETFTHCVGKPFVAWNPQLGDARPPVLMINVVRDDDPMMRLDIFAKAVNELGLDVSIQQMRQELQLKPPTGDDDIAPGMRSAQPADADPAEGPVEE